MPKLLAALIGAALLVGVSGCRDLVAPTEGYIVIETVLHPVHIHTSALEGTGWIEAFTRAKAWEQIFTEPKGAFIYDEVMPIDVWHCMTPASEGCVARIRVGDEKGFLATGRAEGAIYVCTENYVQRMGRKHCGKRAFEAYNSPYSNQDPRYDTVELPALGTFGPPQDAYADQDNYVLHGDVTTRLVSGHANFPNANSHHPPAEGGSSARWHEQPWTPDEPILFSPALETYVADIGACSIFVPLEWENRIDDPFTPVIGAFTGNRGIAEILIDGMLQDPPPPSIRYKEDVAMWADAAAVISTRRDVSPEVHFRVAPAIDGTNELKPQLGVKLYMTAGTDLNTGIDDWYRWDQGFLGGLLSLAGIGSCKAHPVSLMYFGEIGMKNGHGYFATAQDPVANMEYYSIAKPACRNTFLPQVIDGLKEGAQASGAQNFSDGVDALVQGLQDYVRVAFSAPAFTVRDLVLTPTGIYVVTAYTVFDEQYQFGLGNCIADLQTPTMNPVLQPKANPEYTTRGITRPVP